jgi:aspartyl-tRNA(Asn)/glutamyl-tRNA(Gln) amidotransferase subunit A
MNSLFSLTISEMRQGLLDGTFSSKELTAAHLARIDSTNATLNSFLTVSSTRALQDAEQSDKILSEKKNESPLLCGIPIAIKDMILTKGIETTCASKILKGFVPPYDATVVRKLKKAGAVIVGKTNLDEFAMGSSNENSAFGAVKNPWNIDCVPGGSSGGSAVAVASGQAPISLGTDTGGSIRQPAAFCGVYGLKPTYGRVSRYGVVAFASSLDQVGPFARDVEDLAITLECLSGFDTHDSTSYKADVPKFHQELKDLSSLKGLRVGIPKQYFIPGIAPDILQQTQASLKALEKLGAELVEISLPHTEQALSVYYILAPAEASSNLARYDGVRYGYRNTSGENLREMYAKTRAEGFGAEVKRRILIGTYVLSTGYYEAYYRKAQEVRTLVMNDFKTAFSNKCDIIATPVSPVPPFKLGEKAQNPLEMYLADIFTIPASLAGLPGLSMPIGFDSADLPIGLQLLAAPFQESILLKTAKILSHEIAFDTCRMTTHKWER